MGKRSAEAQERRRLRVRDKSKQQRQARAQQPPQAKAKNILLQLADVGAGDILGYDHAEWAQVRRGLYSADAAEAGRAFSVVEEWSRAQGVNVAVDATARLVRAKMLDREREREGSAVTETDVTECYAFTILRLVNGITGQAEARRGLHVRAGGTDVSVRHLAKDVGMPHELVDLRMAASHHTMPSLEALRLGCAVALDWLEEAYWRPQEEWLLQWQQANRSAADADAPQPAVDVVHPYFAALPEAAADQDGGDVAARGLAWILKELSGVEQELGLADGHEARLRWRPSASTVAELSADATKRPPSVLRPCQVQVSTDCRSFPEDR